MYLIFVRVRINYVNGISLVGHNDMNHIKCLVQYNVYLIFLGIKINYVNSISLVVHNDIYNLT